MWPIGLQENNNTFRVSSVLSQLAARENHKLLEAPSSKRIQEAKIIIRRCFWRWNFQNKARDIYNQLSSPPIGQLCLGGFSYSIRTVSAQGMTEPRPAAEVQSVNHLVTTRTTPKIACCWLV